MCEIEIDIEDALDMIRAAQKKGETEISIEFDPRDYDLVEEDDDGDSLDDYSNEELEDELERRKRAEIQEIECDIEEIASTRIDTSKAAAIEFFTDVLRLTHHATVDEILAAVKDKIS